MYIAQNGYLYMVGILSSVSGLTAPELGHAKTLTDDLLYLPFTSLT